MSPIYPLLQSYQIQSHSTWDTWHFRSLVTTKNDDSDAGTHCVLKVFFVAVERASECDDGRDRKDEITQPFGFKLTVHRVRDCGC